MFRQPRYFKEKRSKPYIILSCFIASVPLSQFMLAILIFIYPVTTMAIDNDDIVEFQIQENTLTRALIEFSRQSGIQLIINAKSLQEYKSDGLQGKMNPIKALEILLQSTNVIYEYTGDDTIVIRDDTKQTINPMDADNAVDEPLESQIERDSDTINRFEEITVTARKRSESLQDVPITMQVYKGEDLADLGVVKISDVVKLAPNLTISTQNPVNRAINIRGVGTNDFFGNAPGSVGIYIDEVTMNSPYLSTISLYDMERVEILRGPQNSLFGRNTTGGAVNYISRLPEVGNDIEGNFRAVYGNYDRLEFEGGITLPLGDTTAIRLAGLSYTRDGIWNDLDAQRDYGESNRHAGRAIVVWEPSEHTSFTFNIHTAHDDSETIPLKYVGATDPNDVNLLSPPAIVDFERQAITTNRQGFVASSNNWEDVYRTGANKALVDTDGGYIRVEHTMSSVSFTSITSYDQVKTLHTHDTSGSGNIRGNVNNESLVIDLDQYYEQFSQEIRLTSVDDDARFRWIAGMYYFSEDSELSQNIRWGTNGVLSFSQLVGIPNVFSNTVAFSIAKLENEVFSPYFHTEYKLTDKLNLVFGLRYTYDKEENPILLGGGIDITGKDPSTFYSNQLIRQMASGLSDCPPINTSVPVNDPAYSLPFQAPCATITRDRDDLEFEEIGGKIGVDYRFNNHLMAYASYSRGFKSGKYDIEFLHTPLTPFADDPVDVETLDAIEVGFKSTLFNDSLYLNGATFFYNWNDQQVFNVDSLSGPEFINMPETRIMGLELEARWTPAEYWSLHTAIGIMDSEIMDATGVNIAQEGHPLPFVSDYSANVLLIKDFPIGANLLTFQAGLMYLSSSKVKLQEAAPIDEYDERLELNARLSYAFGSRQQYSLSLFAENLTEDRYCLHKENLESLSGGYHCQPNEGQRMFGIQGMMNF